MALLFGDQAIARLGRLPLPRLVRNARFLETVDLKLVRPHLDGSDHFSKIHPNFRRSQRAADRCDDTGSICLNEAVGIHIVARCQNERPIEPQPSENEV
ncbi:hypothetical protein [Devosia aurantiaca]|uniref:Uncharacterized protein n=1 Tax=Devosia aurantiaca TaxID=2714858 RepID=A0A6M1SDT8_9HYPH|nr:hypothetical protein [Devosia aurantiaca]NGP18029.1 hypothetical protein [Devosia aurantiaca]